MIPGRSTAGFLCQVACVGIRGLRGMTRSQTKPRSGIQQRLPHDLIARVIRICRRDCSRLEIREYQTARSRLFTPILIQELVSLWISSGTGKPVSVVVMAFTMMNPVAWGATAG